MNQQILCYIFSLFFIPLVITSCASTPHRQPANLQQERDSANLPIDQLKVQKGFEIKLYGIVPGARSMALHPDGSLFVSTGGFSNPYDRIYRLRDKDRNFKISNDEIEILIEGLENPNGIAIKGDQLFVAEISRIRVFKNISTVPWGSILRPDQGEVLPIQLPTEGYHGWKYLRFKPNSNWLYFAVGAPCNVCKQQGMFNQIFRFDIEAHKLELVAKGQRNSVGFDFHPATGNFWFTDNGRDLAGENFPPDELNEVTKLGEDFGFPYCHGKVFSDRRHLDKEFNKNGQIDCSKLSSPKLELNPHGAALGMRFVSAKFLPKEYHEQVIVAEHGSWNRDKRIGYQVGITVDLSKDQAKYQPFAWGWLNPESNQAWGRPVDVELHTDSSILISDDGIRDSINPGAIYRVVYTKQHPYPVRK